MKKLLLIILTFFAFTVQSQTKIVSALEETYYEGLWEYNGGYNYEYDTNNNLTSESYYYYYNNVWTPSDKINYTYNANNRVITQIYLSWDNNQFDNTSKTTYTYNASNKPTSIINQEWNGSSWVNDSKTDISYSGIYFVNAITKIWNGSQYIDDYKSTPTYTGNNATQWLNEQWDGTQWNIDNRTLLTYNTNNRITNYKTQTWTGTAWEEEENFDFVLASNGNHITETFSLYGSIQDKVDYNYDSNALMSNFGNPFKDKTGIDYVLQDFPYINKILVEIFSSYDSASSTYETNSRTTYNYINSLPLANEDFKLHKISLYPNPVISTFVISELISSEKISIYNVLGNKVFEGTTTANEKVNVEHLSSGLYFLNFENGSTIKFIKQ